MLVCALIAVGAASAAEVSGGMSIISPEALKTIFAGISAVITAALGLQLYRKTRENGDLRREVQQYVTQSECANYRCAINHRLDELGPALERLFKKLAENDRNSEERSVGLHRRIDPILEKVAANAAEVQIVKRLVLSGAEDKQ